MLLFHITLLFIYLSTSDSSMLEDIKENFLSLLRRANNNKDNNDFKIKSSDMRYFQDTDNSTKQVLNEANIYPEDQKKINITMSVFPLDLKVITKLPWFQGKPKDRIVYRRQYKYKDLSTHETHRESSTSTEMHQWKEDFDVDWYNLKIKAIREQTSHNLSQAYNVNLAAARPWSIPCGDQNQFDMPWGSCTMPSECDAEYRIYRGDSFCDHLSQFVCCAVQHTQHDLYQALDFSFIHSSESTSSEAKRKRAKGSREQKRKKTARQKNRIRRVRFRRKRQIKKKIRKIGRQIRKELNRAFRNATDDRRLKTRKLKQLIKNMKHKFALDRKVARQVRDADFVKIDLTLHDKLNHIKKLNNDFLMNDTFREIVIGRHTKAEDVLFALHPELAAYMRSGNDTEQPNEILQLNETGQINETGQTNETGLPNETGQPIDLPSGRRSGGVIRKKKRKTKRKDYLEYDIEYGALYF